MKLARRILLGLAVLLVVAAIGVALSLDSLVKQAVERGGSYALGVPTTLEDASVGLLSGHFALERLHVVNPPGFAQPDFFAVRAVALELPLSALRKDAITIPSLEIEGISIDLERNSHGTNYGVILDNLKRFDSGASPAPAGESSGEPAGKGKTYTLKKLVIRDVLASVDLLPEAGNATKVSLSIRGVVVENLGSDMSLAQICALVVKTVVQAAVEQGAGQLPEDLLEDLRGRAEALEGAAHAQLDATVKEAASKVGGEAGKALEQAGSAVGEELDGLLHKKKKKP